jgi:hypothetical protein
MTMEVHGHGPQAEPRPRVFGLEGEDYLFFRIDTHGQPVARDVLSDTVMDLSYTIRRD